MREPVFAFAKMKKPVFAFAKMREPVFAFAKIQSHLLNATYRTVALAECLLAAMVALGSLLSCFNTSLSLNNNILIRLYCDFSYV